jgi:flagellar basal body-associated protein FliL
MPDNYEDLKKKEKITSYILIGLIIVVSIAVALLTFVLVSGI